MRTARSRRRSPPARGLGGHYVFLATSGSVSATADVVAVETAGGGARPSAEPSAPATSTGVPRGVADPGTGIIAPLLVLVGAAAVAGTLLVLRPRDD